MRIERERYLILKKSRHGIMVLCYVSNKPRFCYITTLTGERIASFQTEAKARQAFKTGFGAWNDKRYRVVRVIESYMSVRLNSKLFKDLQKRVEEETNLSEDMFNFWDEPDSPLGSEGLDAGCEKLKDMQTLVSQVPYHKRETRNSQFGVNLVEIGDQEEVDSDEDEPKQQRLGDCKYLKITDTGGDVLDHSDMQWDCLLEKKELPFGILHCRKCSKYEKKQDDTLS